MIDPGGATHRAVYNQAENSAAGNHTQKRACAFSHLLFIQRKQNPQPPHSVVRKNAADKTLVVSFIRFRRVPHANLGKPDLTRHTAHPEV